MYTTYTYTLQNFFFLSNGGDYQGKVLTKILSISIKRQGEKHVRKGY